MKGCPCRGTEAVCCRLVALQEVAVRLVAPGTKSRQHSEDATWVTGPALRMPTLQMGKLREGEVTWPNTRQGRV